MPWELYDEVVSWIWFNTLRPRQNGRHFPDNIFKCIFLNENVWISIKISLNFVPRGPINNIPALVQIMAGSRPGDKPLSEPMVVCLLMHICVTRPQWVNGTNIHCQYGLMLTDMFQSWRIFMGRIIYKAQLGGTLLDHEIHTIIPSNMVSISQLSYGWHTGYVIVIDYCVVIISHGLAAWCSDCGCFDSLWPNDAMRRHKSRSTWSQVMACCLTAPSHYGLNLTVDKSTLF